MSQIEAILLEFTGYGYRRVTKELNRRGVRVNKKRPSEADAAPSLAAQTKTRVCAHNLAVILDVFSRKVIGWALSASLKADLAVEALQMALRTRQIEPGLIHHSDRGVQYASEQYVALLHKHGILIGMSRKGNPYDNATLESFIKTLKVEEVYLNEYATEAKARENIGAFIETTYKIERLHSSLGYHSPDEFEALHRLHNAV